MAHRNIENYLSEDVRIFMRQVIEEAHGNEVFFIGRIDDNKCVDRIEVRARGSQVEVPAIIAHLNKGEVVIHNHPSGHLNPSAADMQIASIVGNDGIGFFIVDNPVERIYVVVEPFLPPKAVPLDLARLKKWLSPDGKLARTLPMFEYREAQIGMLEKVAEAFNDRKIALIEAGTGTGKTMAYLIPAIQWALANKKRVVISTNTINLQEQLTKKDIPILQRLFKKKFSVELVKGRSNYVCLRKLYEAEAQPGLFELDEAQNELKRIVEWAKRTTDGSRSDLGTAPSEKVWEKIQSESDTTLRSRCRYYNQCFFYQARRRAAVADILVANHHLLFADLSVRSANGGISEVAVLPKYDRVILDEAHNLEDVASKYFGVRLTYLGVQRILNRLSRVKDGKNTGLLHVAEHKVRKYSGKIYRVLLDDFIKNLHNQAVPQVEKCRVLLDEVLDPLFHWILNREKSNYDEIKLRLTDAVISQPDWQERIREVPRLVKSMTRLSEHLLALVKLLGQMRGAFEKEADSLAVDIRAQSERLLASAMGLQKVLLETDRETIRWLEVRESRYGNIFRFCTAPLDIAPILQENLYEKFPTIIMTSATLTVDKRFQYFCDRVGLSVLEDGARKTETLLPSPFDFHRQVIIGIPTGISEPNQAGFERELPGLLLKAIRASRGRAFVLFTAYGLLQRMYNLLQPTLEAEGLVVYRQGEMSRHRLLHLFREDTSSVLFATDSFWEGVDVQGEALAHVIIPRLPFRVPSEPVIEARVEAIDRRGGNSFMEYTVPQAVIKFKQGFGRLIRNKTDYGAITILDHRIVSKHYGRMFLSSLPDCQVVVGQPDEVFARIESFLKTHDEKRKGHAPTA